MTPREPQRRTITVKCFICGGDGILWNGEENVAMLLNGTWLTRKIGDQCPNCKGHGLVAIPVDDDTAAADDTTGYIAALEAVAALQAQVAALQEALLGNKEKP